MNKSSSEDQDCFAKAQLIRALISCIAKSVGIGVLVYLAVTHGSEELFAIAFAFGWQWSYVPFFESQSPLVSVIQGSFALQVSAAVIHASTLCFWIKASHWITSKNLSYWIFSAVTILAVLALITAAIGLGSKDIGISFFNFFFFWSVVLGYMLSFFYQKILAENLEES